jgi:hypothetical protein
MAGKARYIFMGRILPGININGHVMTGAAEPRRLGDLVGSSYSNNKAQEDECDKNPYTFPVPVVTFF